MGSVSRLVAAIMRLGDGLPCHGVEVDKVPVHRGRVPPRFEVALRPMASTRRHGERGLNSGTHGVLVREGDWAGFGGA